MERLTLLKNDTLAFVSEQTKLTFQQLENRILFRLQRLKLIEDSWTYGGTKLAQFATEEIGYHKGLAYKLFFPEELTTEVLEVFPHIVIIKKQKLNTEVLKNIKEEIKIAPFKVYILSWDNGVARVNLNDYELEEGDTRLVLKIDALITTKKDPGTRDTPPTFTCDNQEIYIEILELYYKDRLVTIITDRDYNTLINRLQKSITLI